MTKPLAVLVVDQDAALRTRLGESLREAGYQVSTAATGEEALACCAGATFDVILTDVRAPGLGNPDVFRRLRRHARGVRVVIASSSSVAELQEFALDEGSLALFPKALDLDAVIGMLVPGRYTSVLLVTNAGEAATPLCHHLTGRGIRVVQVKSAYLALELAEEVRFDLVLFDPPVREVGIDLYLQLVRLTPATIAVLAAGRPAETARDGGATSYTLVAKPLSHDRLMETLLAVDRSRGAVPVSPVQRSRSSR